MVEVHKLLTKVSTKVTLRTLVMATANNEKEWVRATSKVVPAVPVAEVVEVRVGQVVQAVAIPMLRE